MLPDAPIDFESLLDGAVAAILEEEDPAHLVAWLVDHLPDHLDPEVQESIAPDTRRALAANLARAIWNVTPLPGNRYRPAPLPAPRRNDPCLCGSGRKYKHCCASAPPLPRLSTDTMWCLVLDHVDDNEIARGRADKQIPVSAVVDYASRLLDEEDPGSAHEVLRTVFEGQPLAALNSDAHEHALDLYSNACDELGLEEQKLELLERVVREAVRSPLRAGAWERLATVRMDDGDVSGAWEAFRNAQRDQPGAPALAHLEILLLHAEGRHGEMAERARHWARQLRRKGFDRDGSVVDW